MNMLFPSPDYTGLPTENERIIKRTIICIAASMHIRIIEDGYG